MVHRHVAWLLALAACLVAAAPGAETPPPLDLEMSTRLTLDPTGTPPAAVAEPVAPVAATRPVRWPWLVALALLGAACGWAGARLHAGRRAPAPAAAEVRGQLLRSETSVAELRARADATVAERDAARQTAQDLRGQLEEATVTCHALRAERQEQGDTLARLRDDNEELVAQVDALVKQVEDAARRPPSHTESEALALARDQAARAIDERASTARALEAARREIGTLRAAHDRIAADNANLKIMLETAEDRVDAQATALREQREDLDALRAQSEREAATAKEARRASNAAARLRSENRELRAQLAAQVASRPADGGGAEEAVADGAADGWAARTIEQLTRSRDAALNEMRALRARLDGDGGADPGQALRTAQVEIKMLKSDLRVRADVIKALERDAEQLAEVQAALEEQGSRAAFLNNELALALDEIKRLKGKLKAVADGAPHDATLAALREQIAELRARLEAKDQIIATLEAGRQKRESRNLKSEVEQLRADQRASVSVIRFLEKEIERLSGGASSSRAG